MERVIILGCGGAGKSTLARELGRITRLPVIHLDKLFWRDHWQAVSNEEFDTLLNAELENSRWILDGNYSRTLQARLARCDTVVYLDYPRWQCLLGVCKRILTTYGRTRPDMGPNCKERFDWDFLKWVWNFNRDHRERLYRYLRQTEGIEVIILQSRKQGARFLKTLETT